MLEFQIFLIEFLIDVKTLIRKYYINVFLLLLLCSELLIQKTILAFFSQRKTFITNGYLFHKYLNSKKCL